MSKLSNLDFMALDITGKNYFSWILDAEVHLSAKTLGNTIVQNNKESPEDRSKALIFLRHHLDEALKSQYLTVKDPYTLWTELKDRFDHQKTVILPRARYEWMHLGLQDFKSVITDADLLEKTYSTFHASNILLQQQYRERQFKKYSELISCVLVVEKNNELLLKNHQSHPAGSIVAPEMNATTSRVNADESHGKEQGRSLGPEKPNFKKKAGNNSHYQKGKKNVFPKHKGKSSQSHSKHHESVCHRCGSPGHWPNVFRTARHLVDLYQASIKGKEKKAETIFSQYDIPMNIMPILIFLTSRMMEMRLKTWIPSLRMYKFICFMISSF
ncbi:uncharacterized protein LOC113315554 [Papaver somniferum]|uniref:uncharacterized protein LOC113315554 n=1 Tax=Papaver somniferum TaxID=3469 RepID=UPI000E6F973B|nr:uncharacterized protein LOC113315554 [Papaver somniferum]